MFFKKHISLTKIYWSSSVGITDFHFVFSHVTMGVFCLFDDIEHYFKQ